MKSSFIICAFILLVAVQGCKETWDEYYGDYPETVDQNVWDAMKSNEEISQFVQLLVDNDMDTLFKKGNIYSVFAPTNAAIEAFLSNSENRIDTILLKYHISNHLIVLNNISGKRKIQTCSKKFALLEKHGDLAMLDGKSISFESPLFENGKYFIIEQVAAPLPNMYEFFGKKSPVLKDYIDKQDSIILDPENSIPIGFDEAGNTIYDSVKLVFNEFEEEFFPVSKESRSRTATIVFPLQEDFNNALTEMAQYIGGSLVDYNDIPIEWQHEILVPYLLKQGVFENMLEPEAFAPQPGIDTLRLKNILGDSVKILYSPVDKAICSNGYAYNYASFRVPDSLYKEAVRFEGESLVEKTGLDKYVWNDKATIVSDDFFEPYREFVSSASNDSILRVLFPLEYEGSYSIEFRTNFLFPRSYIMVVNTHMDYGGIYDIYVNDEYVKTFDYYDYVRYRGGIIPSVTGSFFIPQGRFNKFDFFVDNITGFGKAKVRFEYKGPGRAPSHGLVIDYVDFMPVAN